MRRSKAPSQIGKLTSLSQISGRLQRGESNFCSTGLQNNARILKLISNNEKNDNVSENVNECGLKAAKQSNTLKEDVTSSSGTSSGQPTLRIFNVVYGKQSTKKHKTWDDDGTLEVGTKTATLKDSDGRILGQSSLKKTDELSEGSRLFVGNKEVEVISLYEGEPIPTKKRKQDSPPSSPKFKKKPLHKKTVGSVVPSMVKPRVAEFSTKQDFEPLIMPEPDEDHQWNCNINHLPVTVVKVDGSLCRSLRPHQREGVKFLYRCVTGMRSLKHTGAILADEMGLGKTLQCVTLVWTLLRQGPYGNCPLLRRALIVVPSSLVQNWDKEFMNWIGSHRIKTFVVDKKNKPIDYLKFPHVPVMIISYEMFVRSFEDIKEIEFDLIICDEGHRLKNNSIRAAMLLDELGCTQRIILTGTPVQNDLQEFYALVNFVNPGILGTPSEFHKNFEEPIVASRNPEASAEELQQGEIKAEELSRITNGFILRRTQAVIGAFLPRKYEYVLFCDPTSVQREVYNAATDFWFRMQESGLNTKETVAHLSVICALKKICNHPALARKDDENSEESLSSILNDALPRDYSIENPTIEDSSKLQIIVALLESMKKTKERVVLVSNYTQTLDLLGAVCDKNGYKYNRFDGSTPVSQRASIVEAFNSPHSSAFVLLLSSKAGGVGLNLIGGSRLVLFDSDWNPATDIQAMARIWREGQKKNVFIYRLLTSGTIEEKIFQRQLSKAGLSESIIDPCSVSSVKLSDEELKDLFSWSSSRCVTHDALKCSCSGIGEVISRVEEEEASSSEDERDCELLPSKSPRGLSSLRMNQLYHWLHYTSPLPPTLLQEMGLEQAAQKINFVFRNMTS